MGHLVRRMLSMDILFLVFETKGLSLEQVDGVLEEPNPRTSSKWVPTTTFSQEVDMSDKKDVSLLIVKIV
jgi:SP family sugar:H+ symporter-like MFS transporter